jgi:protein SCO1/2
MDAMVMRFRVATPKALNPLLPGAKIEFTLVVDRDSSWAENIRVVEFNSAEPDPVETRRLRLLGSILGPGQPAPLAIGQPVPDFTLIDQNSRPVMLSRLAGKVVAMNFVYTRCPLPDYCFRLSNNLALLQKRFAERMGRDFVLLTVTFDPAHDRPDVLATYARIWKADPRAWHFLTGALPDVQRVCSLFGVGFWQDEGTFTHSLHTVVIDRKGILAANIEGNQYTAQQLGDLVESVLKPAR